MWYLLLYAILALWVLIDGLTRKIGLQTVLWSLGTTFLGPLVLPLYMAKRPLKTGEVREGGTAWNVLKNFAILWTFVMIVVTFAALIAVGKEAAQVKGGAEMAGAAIGTALGLGFLAMLWFLPTIGAALLGFLLKKNSVVETGPTGPLAGSSSQGNIASGWVGLAGAAIVALITILGSSNRDGGSEGRGGQVRSSPVQQSDSADSMPTTPGDKWKEHQESNAMDSSSETSLTLEAENEIRSFIGSYRPTLVIRCQKEQTEVAILVGKPAQHEYGSYDTYSVRLKFDDGRPIKQRWTGSTNMKALFAPNAVKLAKELSKTKIFLFEFTPFQEGEETIRFDVTSLDKHLEKVADTCGWKLDVASTR